jgi:hypothetical protein
MQRIDHVHRRYCSREMRIRPLNRFRTRQGVHYAQALLKAQHSCQPRTKILHATKGSIEPCILVYMLSGHQRKILTMNAQHPIPEPLPA